MYCGAAASKSPVYAVLIDMESEEVVLGMLDRSTASVTMISIGVPFVAVGIMVV